MSHTIIHFRVVVVVVHALFFSQLLTNCWNFFCAPPHTAAIFRPSHRSDLCGHFRRLDFRHPRRLIRLPGQCKDPEVTQTECQVPHTKHCILDSPRTRDQIRPARTLPHTSTRELRALFPGSFAFTSTTQLLASSPLRRGGFFFFHTPRNRGHTNWIFQKRWGS